MFLTALQNSSSRAFSRTAGTSLVQGGAAEGKICLIPSPTGKEGYRGGCAACMLGLRWSRLRGCLPDRVLLLSHLLLQGFIVSPGVTGLFPSQTSITGSQGTSPCPLWGSIPCSSRVTWQVSGGQSLVYSTLAASGLPWGSGRCFQAVASFGHLAPEGLCIKQGMFLAEL